MNELFDEKTYQKIRNSSTEKITKTVKESIKNSSIPKDIQNRLLPGLD